MTAAARKALQFGCRAVPGADVWIKRQQPSGGRHWPEERFKGNPVEKGLSFSGAGKVGA